MAMCEGGFVKGQGNWIRGYWRIQAKDYGRQDGEMQIVVDIFYIMEVGCPSFKAGVLVVNKGTEKFRILT